MSSREVKSLNGLTAVNAKILILWGEQSYAKGHYALAEKHFKLALEELETLKLESDVLPQVINNLAATYRIQGKHVDAEPLLRGCVPISERILGKDHPDVAITHHNLASLYFDQGKYPEAEACYRRAMEIYEGADASHHPVLLRVLKNYANTLRKIDDALQAEAIDRRIQALSIKGNV